MHYYQFNIGDYKSHTDHLDLLEDLAFRRMMDWCYLHESPLPLDLNVIAKKILMRTHTDSIASVLEEFFHKTENGYLNKRITCEVEAFKAKSDKARKSAEARWGKVKPQSDSNANALRTQSDSNAKHKTLNTKHKTLNNKQETAKETLLPVSNLSFEIFKYWCEVMGKSISTSKLTSNRDKAIKARLKEGYTVEQIKAAIDGCRKDPFSMGQNDRQKPFNDIQLICRNGEKLESFLTGHVAKQGDINSISTNFDAPEDWNNE
mgnify:FL=1|tara:strand:+ start:10056 stop:10841 length:786 start_codon:yes stop_codon:yes gene_type:complete